MYESRYQKATVRRIIHNILFTLMYTEYRCLINQCILNKNAKQIFEQSGRTHFTASSLKILRTSDNYNCAERDYQFNAPQHKTTLLVCPTASCTQSTSFINYINCQYYTIYRLLSRIINCCDWLITVRRCRSSVCRMSRPRVQCRCYFCCVIYVFYGAAIV